MSRSRFFLVFAAIGLATVVALVQWANSEGRRWQRQDLPGLQRLVSRLGLSDLALWTEARYTRHPSQTDLFSAFQDFPAAPEHFPAGSITPPPPALTDPAAFVAPTSRGREGDARGDRRRRDVGATKDPSDGDVGASNRLNTGDGSP